MKDIKIVQSFWKLNFFDITISTGNFIKFIKLRFGSRSKRYECGQQILVLIFINLDQRS